MCTGGEGACTFAVEVLCGGCSARTDAGLDYRAHRLVCPLLPECAGLWRGRPRPAERDRAVCDGPLWVRQDSGSRSMRSGECVSVCVHACMHGDVGREAEKGRNGCPRGPFGCGETAAVAACAAVGVSVCACLGKWGGRLKRGGMEVQGGREAWKDKSGIKATHCRLVAYGSGQPSHTHHPCRSWGLRSSRCTLGWTARAPSCCGWWARPRSHGASCTRCGEGLGLG